MNRQDISIIGIGVYRDKLSSSTQLWANMLDPDYEETTQAVEQNARQRVLKAAIEDCRFGSTVIYSGQKLALYASDASAVQSDDILSTLLPGIELVSSDTLDQKNETPELLRALDSLQEKRSDLAVVMDGSLALVLQRMDSNIRGQNPCYARFRGAIPDSRLQAETRALYSTLEIDPTSISYLLVFEQAEKQRVETDRAISSFYTAGSPAYTLPVAILAKDRHGKDEMDSPVSLLSLLAQASLALSNKLIPGNKTTDRAKHSFEAPLYPISGNRPWFHPHTQVRRAAIHDPASGTHLVLEEIAETSTLARDIKLPLPWEAELAVFSSANRSAMVAVLRQFIQASTQKDPAWFSPIDMARSLQNQLDSDLPFRLAIVFEDLEDIQQIAAQAIEQLQSESPPLANSPIYYGDVSPAKSPNVACLFPGLGFPGLVGRYTDNFYQMSLRIPEIRQAFDLVELRGNLSEDPYPTSHLFFPTGGYSSEQAIKLKKRLASPKRSEALSYGIPDQKNLSSFCVALANWSSWIIIQSLDIPIQMTFGQSLGELSALCAAGKLDYQQFTPIYWNTEVEPEYFSDAGGLALVSANAENIEPIIADYPTVVIAVHISPGFQLLGGKQSELKDCIEKLKKDSIWTQHLPYPAIHTPYFSGLRKSMEPAIESIPVYPSSLDVYSGMITDIYPDDAETVRSIMLDNLDHPVHLWQVTRKMYADGARVFVQAGGGATMYSQAKTNIGADDVTAVSIDVDYRGPIEQLNHLCATLFTAGVPLDLGWLTKYRPSRPERWENAPLIQSQLDSGVAEQAADDPGNDVRPQDSDENSAYEKLPFFGNIQSYTRGESILVEYTLDLGRDLHLADHAFIIAQEIKPLSECLTVLPMTVSLEVMAQTAAYLARGYGLIGFENINATNWIALRDTSTLKLHIQADLQPADSTTDSIRVAVSIRSEGRNKPDISGVVILSRQYHETLSLTLPELENPRLYPLDPEAIYRGGTLFHGPLFQCISGDTWLGDHGIIGELVVNSKRGMFADNDNPVMLVDPLLLDAVGQLIGIWAMERGDYVYPISVENVEIYAPTPAVGTRVPVIININSLFLKTLYADIEIQDGNGHLWMRIRNWGDWAFKWPRQCVDYIRRPYQSLFASPLNIQLPGKISSYIAQNVLIDASMLEMMARTALERNEFEHYTRLEKYPERQKQWLIGRIVAKDAVRSWLESNGNYLHPAEIIIDTEDTGQPVVRTIPGYPRPHISISHTDKYTVALAGDLPVGIDIEAIQERDTRFVETFSTPVERQLLEYMDVVNSGFAGIVDFKDEPQRFTLLWSAKESAGKVAGTGLPANPKQIELERVDSDGLLHLHHIPLNSQINVNSWLSDNHCITVALNE